jgi:hypothetical protein
MCSNHLLQQQVAALSSVQPALIEDFCHSMIEDVALGGIFDIMAPWMLHSFLSVSINCTGCKPNLCMPVQVQVVPLPPPSLEPPKVVVRVPKAVRERQEAAAAAAAQKEAATAVDANAAPASEDAPEQAEPTSEVGGIPSLEQPSYAKTAALASRGSDAEGAEKESDKAQPREREVKSRSPVRRRSLSLSPALSIERSPPARKV